jgi:DNA replication protein DnaC
VPLWTRSGKADGPAHQAVGYRSPIRETLMVVDEPIERALSGATLVTSNLSFDEWTSVFGSERLTGALLDRLMHHVQSWRRMAKASGSQPARRPTPT